MAPEQIEGRPDVGPAADVFSLGCVLYECLTGHPPFGGEQVIAVLARVLHGRAPRVSELRPEVPAELVALVARWMSRDPSARPADGGAAAAELRALPPMPDTLPLEEPEGGRAAFSGERSPIAVVLAAHGDASADPGATVSSDDLRGMSALAHEVAARWGGVASSVGAATMLVFADGNGLRDLATRGARAALELRADAPSWSVRLAVARAESVGGQAASDLGAIDLDEEADAAPTRSGVSLDAIAASLLDPCFEVEAGARGALLRAYHPSRDEDRTVLGRATPCVGREKELRLLEGTWDECVEERSPRAAILVAGQGIGKSRVRRELVTRLTARATARVLTARCDVAGRAVPLSAARAWVEDAAALDAGSAGEARWEALRAYLAPKLAAAGVADATDVAELVGELGHAAPASPAGALAAVRNNAAATRQELTRALGLWLRAEAAAVGLVLVLEDLHWADPMTLGLLQGAWESLDDQAVFLVATAWPDAGGAAPPLAALKGAQVIRLEPLGARAAERLARQVLGPAPPAEDIERVARMSGGNAFLLEEILRAAAHGAALDAMPGSVLALVQSRLRALPLEARRCLRAASVFGERFEEGGVRALLAGEAVGDPRDALAALRREELVAPAGDAARGAVGLWAFRHSLVREAAYESFAGADRAAAHLAAARWLGQRPDAPPAVVADQLERGGARGEAAEWFLRAVREASLLGDFETALSLTRRGEGEAVAPLTSARLIYYEAYALLVCGRLPDVITRLDALDWSRYPPGTAARTLLRATDLGVRVHAGQRVDATAGLDDLSAPGSLLEVSLESAMATSILLVTLMHLGLRAAADGVAALLSSAPADPERDFDFCSLRDHYLGCYRLSNDDGAAVGLMRSARRHAERLGSRTRMREVQGALPLILVEHGAFEEASARLTEEEATSNRFIFDDWLLVGRIWYEALGPAPTDVSALETSFRAPGWRVTYGWGAMVARASAGLARRDDPWACQAAYDALLAVAERHRPFVSQEVTFRALLAELSVYAGRLDDALRHADEGLALPLCSTPLTLTMLHHARVRGLLAAGRSAEAREALERARERLRRFAEPLGGPDRASWLAHPLNARTLALSVPPTGVARVGR